MNAEPNHGHWTVETLKQYVDALLLERKDHVHDMFVERDKAIREFKDSTEKNFASRNEIQTAMKDAQQASERATATLVATLMPRSEAMALIQRNEQDVKAITDRVNDMTGFGKGVKDSWGWIVALVMLAAAVYEAVRK